MATIAELFNQATGYYQSGNWPQAEVFLRQLLQAEPGHTRARHLLGVLANQAGRPEIGIPLIREAIALDPSIAAFHSNLGIALEKQGQLVEAIQCYRQALRLDPKYINARHNLANVFFRQGQFTEAAECFREALRVNPADANAYFNLGNALWKQGQLTEAADCYRQVVALNPNNAAAHNSLGIALEEQGQSEKAALCFRQALAIDANLADAHNNLGNILKDQGHYSEAAACFRQALALDPNNKIARWNRSILRLLQGDFEGGWPDFELRWSVPTAVAPDFQQPRWDGTSLAGKTILVYTEGGLGDTLQFMRYLPLVKERGGTVVFACQPALRPLLVGIAGIDRITTTGPPWPDCAVQISLLSLPGLFRTTLANIPAKIPYLAADSKRVEYWRHELTRDEGQGARGEKMLSLSPLPPRPSPLTIGIAWDTNPKHKEYRFRSVPLKYFEALVDLDNVQLVNLQKGPGTSQIASWSGRRPILDFGDRLDADGAFLDTAALMMNLDLVISVDTALTHLAGALGVPVWMAMQYASDWRWLLDRPDCPWYPTLRLFRKPRDGDWAEVFERMAKEIRNPRI